MLRVQSCQPAFFTAMSCLPVQGSTSRRAPHRGPHPPRCRVFGTARIDRVGPDPGSRRSRQARDSAESEQERISAISSFMSPCTKAVTLDSAGDQCRYRHERTAPAELAGKNTIDARHRLVIAPTYQPPTTFGILHRAQLRPFSPSIRRIESTFPHPVTPHAPCFFFGDASVTVARACAPFATTATPSTCHLLRSPGEFGESCCPGLAVADVSSPPNGAPPRYPICSSVLRTGVRCNSPCPAAAFTGCGRGSLWQVNALYWFG